MPRWASAVDAELAGLPSLSVPLTILDLAVVGEGESVRASLEGSVRLAQRAEDLGYRRVWYAEHHDIAGIASSATAVLIAHIAAHTKTNRLGAGGIMLPNHALLLIAEQLGTLATLPFAFASHFAPTDLFEAIRLYRAQSTPSAQCARPRVLVGVNVVATDSEAEARHHLNARRRAFVRPLFARPRVPASRPCRPRRPRARTGETEASSGPCLVAAAQ